MERIKTLKEQLEELENSDEWCQLPRPTANALEVGACKKL